jgi:hypothetical protein
MHILSYLLKVLYRAFLVELCLVEPICLIEHNNIEGIGPIYSFSLFTQKKLYYEPKPVQVRAILSIFSPSRCDVEHYFLTPAV